MEPMKALPARTQAEQDAAAEGRILAAEMARDMERYAKACWEQYQKPPRELTKCPEGVDPEAFWKAQRERLMDRPPDETGWWTLRELEELDPDLAARKWEEVKQQATDGLRLGHRASRFAHGGGHEPIDYARFLALRRGFVEEWQPRGGVERALIDMMAQAFTMWEHWMGIASSRVIWECRWTQKEADEAGRWKQPLQSEADAVAQANEQTDRWNRVFLRTLRQLRDLRRYSVNITANQANTGQQLVNAVVPPKEPER